MSRVGETRNGEYFNYTVKVIKIKIQSSAYGDIRYITNFTALKNTISEIIPEGYEPYSEYRPNETVDTIIASNSILKRMTPSVILTSLGNKCIIELKNKLKEIYEE